MQDAVDANTRVIDTFSREITIYANLRTIASSVASSCQSTRERGNERERGTSGKSSRM